MAADAEIKRERSISERKTASSALFEIAKLLSCLAMISWPASSADAFLTGKAIPTAVPNPAATVAVIITLPNFFKRSSLASELEK